MTEDWQLAERTPRAVVNRYFCSMPYLVRLLAPMLLAVAVLLAPIAIPAAQSQTSRGELLYLALGDSVPSGADLPDGVGYPRRLGEALAGASTRPINLVNR